MPGATNPKRKKPMPQSRRRKTKRKKQRRGPVMRFRLSQLILLWIMSLILCFGAYLFNRNFHPEKDVFLQKAEESSADVQEITESLPAEEEASQAAEESAAEPAPEESSEETPTTDKDNPVPESAPQSPDYLTKCAFLGEANIHNLGRNGLLQPYNVYASETLTLTNYLREYVMLDGTTIRIMSAINSADCPIYLMFGTESLTTQGADETANQFDQLLNSAIATAPEAPIIVLSIPPVTAFAEVNGEHPIANSVIDDYNTRLLEIANKRDVYFVDVNTALKNNEGKLAPEMAEEDGIHLNAQGGQALLNYVLNHVPPITLKSEE